MLQRGRESATRRSAADVLYGGFGNLAHGFWPLKALNLETAAGRPQGVIRVVFGKA